MDLRVPADHDVGGGDGDAAAQGHDDAVGDEELLGLPGEGEEETAEGTDEPTDHAVQTRALTPADDCDERGDEQGDADAQAP